MLARYTGCPKIDQTWFLVDITWTKNILSTQDAKKLCLHLKFLTCDFFCNELISRYQPATSSACVLCPSPSPVDSIEHALVSCLAMTEIRSRLYPELVNTVAQVKPNCDILREYQGTGVMQSAVKDFACLSTKNKWQQRRPITHS